MKASIIVTIVLRLFAIQWAATGVIGLLEILGYSAIHPIGIEHGFSYWILILASPGCYILMALAAWFFAALFAKRVVPASDPELGLVSISARDLYGAGVLIVGISACLSHLSPMLNWVHYLIMNRAGEALMQGRNGLSFYDVTKELIPCLGGAALAMASARIGARLARAGRIQSRSNRI